jgi:hypothetical protein
LPDVCGSVNGVPALQFVVLLPGRVSIKPVPGSLAVARSFLSIPFRLVERLIRKGYYMGPVNGFFSTGGN